MSLLDGWDGKGEPPPHIERQVADLVVSSNPNFILELRVLGSTLYEAGKVEEAESCYRKAAEIADIHVSSVSKNTRYEVPLMLVKILIETERYSEADQITERFIDEDFDSLHLLVKFRVLYTRRDLLERLHRYDEAMQFNPAITDLEHELENFGRSQEDEEDE